MSRRTIIESVKTLLIILLTVSALVLIRDSGTFSTLGDKLNFASSGENAPAEPTGTGGEMGSTTPAGMAVLLGGEDKYAAVYDAEAIGECYRRFSAQLGEALGSAGEVREITQAQWREALEAQGVFISYPSVQHTDVLAAWLGTAVSEQLADEMGDMFIISLGESENARLYYADSHEGSFHVCETAVNAQTLVNAVSEFQPGGGKFAYETQRLGSVFEYTIIPENTPTVKQIEVSNPVGTTTEMSTLYRAFDFNSGALHQYNEPDGTLVLVEGAKTMRVRSNGKVIYSNGEDLGGAVSRVDAASRAYAVLSSVVLPYSGEGEVALVSAEKQGEDYRVCFDYFVNGIAVELPGEEYAAEFLVCGAGIKEAALNLRCYSYTENEESLLPISQVCAIASSENAADIELVYRENGGEVSAVWVMDTAE